MLVTRPVRIMTARTSEPSSLSPLLLGTRERMAFNRVSPLDSGEKRMAADTEFVDRLEEHEFLVGGMGIMTGHASLAHNNSVHKRQLIILAHQIFQVSVTHETQGHRSVGPKHIRIILAMGVMTECTARRIQGAVHIFLRIPGFFAGVTGKAKVLQLCDGKSNPSLNSLLMAKKALPVNGGTVGPFCFFHQIFMADHAGSLFPQTNRLNDPGIFEVMATLTAFGEFVLLMKKENIWTNGIRIEFGKYRFERQFYPLIAGHYGKSIFSGYER